MKVKELINYLEEHVNEDLEIRVWDMKYGEPIGKVIQIYIDEDLKRVELGV